MIKRLESTKAKFALLAACTTGLAVQLSSQAAPQSVTVTSSPGVVIPDGDLNGVVDTLSLSTPITSISDVELNLDISGGYDGDFYAYLSHGTGFAVLLNRIGSTASNPYGSSDSGMDVIFSGSAANGDIHLASPLGGVLTGTWQPDARNVAPTTALDTSPRSAFLSSFQGLNPNGTWTLFIADVSPLGVGELASLSLEVTGSTGTSVVPDDSSTMLLLVLGVIPLAFWPSRPRWVAAPAT